MGTNVDCYQRAEGRYRLMRGIIEALRDHANPFSILTKGTLITRDLDLLRQAAERDPVGISFSVGFVDEEMWRTVEPGTPSPRRRLDAVRQFADAGFDVHVLMAPILPGLTDTDESIDATVAAIAAAGAARRHAADAAPAARRPGVVPRLARPRPPAPGRPLPGALRRRLVRAKGVPARGGRPGRAAPARRHGTGPGADEPAPGRRRATGTAPRRRRSS